MVIENINKSSTTLSTQSTNMQPISTNSQPTSSNTQTNNSNNHQSLSSSNNMLHLNDDPYGNDQQQKISNSLTDTVSHNFDNDNNKLSYANIIKPSANNNESNSIPDPKSTLNQIPILSHSKYVSKKPDYSDDYVKTPKKDQGIIIESAEGIKIKQYLEAVSEIIKPENIIYAARLSRDRICMYLKTKELVNELTENLDYITIENIDLKIRPLMLRATKFYLNRVCPSIPSAFLHDLITNIGINITSLIQRERMSYGEDDFSHVLSFRRTFYGIPDKNVAIPDSMLVKFEQENHRIFISTEIKRCSNCFKIGHLSEVCNKNINIIECETEIQTDIATPPIQNLNSIDLDLRSSSSSLINITDTDMIDISDMQDNNDTNESSDDENNDKQVKKIKTQNIQSVRATHELEKLFNRYVHSNIDFNSVANFLTQIGKRKVNYEEMRKMYAKQIKEMIEVIETLRGVTQSGTKARLTKSLYRAKIIFKLRNPATQSESKNDVSLYDELKNCSMESL